MIVIGLDENGLGPVLGPLVVTAVAFEAASYDPETFWSLKGPDLPAGDSKVVFTRRNPGAGERAVRRWLSLLGVTQTSHAQLMEQLSVPLPGGLPCPVGGISRPCLPDVGALPAWSKAGDDGISLGIWNRFDAAGIGAVAACCHAACPGWLNLVTSRDGVNKFELDFRLMIGLIEKIAEGRDGDLLAICGKVGSTKSYGRWLDAAGHADHRVVSEEREASDYVLPGVGRVRFERDADSSHLPVAVASMIGKYVRELAMLNLNAALGRHENPVSGYRDPVTARFVTESSGMRTTIGLEDRCFARTS